MAAAKRKPAFKLSPPVVAEQDLHEAVADAFDQLLMPPTQWTCFPAGNMPLPPQFAAKLARMGLKPGWPDFLILHERLFGIELKRVGGVLSKTRLVRTRTGALRQVEGQVDVFPRLVRAGMQIAVCPSLDDVLRALAGWRVPTRLAAVSPVEDPADMRMAERWAEPEG